VVTLKVRNFDEIDSVKAGPVMKKRGAQ